MDLFTKMLVHQIICNEYIQQKGLPLCGTTIKTTPVLTQHYQSMQKFEKKSKQHFITQGNGLQ
jgi:hypothetical protein